MCAYIYQGRIESVGQEGMQLQCSVLKHQISYEFIHDLKNSNNIQEFTVVYQLKWHHSLLECLLMKKLLKTEVQVGSKEICIIAIKTEWLLCKIGRSAVTELLKIDRLTSINCSYLF